MKKNILINEAYSQKSPKLSGKYNPYTKPDKGGYVILKDKKSRDLTKSKGIISATKANRYLKGVNIEPVFHI